MGTLNSEVAERGTPLYTFAETLLENGFTPYDYAKCVWLGSPDPAERLAGDHPWPTRERDGEQFVYSVPVHAGFSAVRGTALFIGKDPWKPVEDPRTWLVAEANLITGKETEHRVLSASVSGREEDPIRNLWLQLAPANYSNFPRWDDRYDENGWLVSRAGVAYNPARPDQIRIQGEMTNDFYLETAALRNGKNSAYTFEDIAVLESMVRLVWQVQHAEDEAEFLERRKKAIDFECGRRAVAAQRALAA